MSTSIVDFRVREEMAGAVLKEVAALEPAERLREAQTLGHLMDQAVQGLEEVWEDFREPLERGVSPPDAGALGRILTRSANLISSSLELLTRDSPSLEQFRQANLARLQRIKAHAASLSRLVEMTTPTPDPERLRRSLEQMQAAKGIDAENFLAELKG
jgi:hypothetical protein